MMTAAIAANRPMAVASKASAMPGATTACEVRGLRFGDANKAIHNAPDRPEQPDKRRHACGRGQKRDPMFELVHLDDRRSQQRAVDGRDASEHRTCGARSWIGSRSVFGVRALPKLSREFCVARLKKSDQWAR